MADDAVNVAGQVAQNPDERGLFEGEAGRSFRQFMLDLTDGATSVAGAVVLSHDDIWVRVLLNSYLLLAAARSNHDEQLTAIEGLRPDVEWRGRAPRQYQLGARNLTALALTAYVVGAFVLSFCTDTGDDFREGWEMWTSLLAASIPIISTFILQVASYRERRDTGDYHAPGVEAPAVGDVAAAEPPGPPEHASKPGEGAAGESKLAAPTAEDLEVMHERGLRAEAATKLALALAPLGSAEELGRVLHMGGVESGAPGVTDAGELWQAVQLLVGRDAVDARLDDAESAGTRTPSPPRPPSVATAGQASPPVRVSVRLFQSPSAPIPAASDEPGARTPSFRRGSDDG